MPKHGKFLSTLSLRRATWALWPQRARLRNFYPRSPCGERPADCAVLVHLYDFYPRSPCGERRVISSCSHTSTYFYPRSPCGERLIHFVPQPPLHAISIHALLAESDHRLHSVGSRDLHFYPRSPCGERRQTAWPGCLPGYFYPRSPCGERLLANGCGFVSMLISIHALLAESDRVRVQL